MYILLYVKHIQCVVGYLWSIGGAPQGFWCMWYSSIWNFFGVVVFHTLVDWRKRPWYMCILLYVKLLWCSSIPYIYGQLEGGPSALSICAFCYVLNIFSAVVFHTSMVDGGAPQWSWYMCILLYVKLLWCSTIPCIYGQLQEGDLDIWAFCYMWNFFGVALFHTSYGQLEGVHLP